VNPAAAVFDSLARILAAGLVALRQPDERIAEALRDGLSVRAVAELLNVSTMTVRRVKLERRP
jgi:DNA-binding NarL/FixJ family response regulator